MTCKKDRRASHRHPADSLLLDGMGCFLMAVVLILIARFSGCEFRADKDGIVVKHEMERWPAERQRQERNR